MTGMRYPGPGTSSPGGITNIKRKSGLQFLIMLMYFRQHGKLLHGEDCLDIQ